VLEKGETGWRLLEPLEAKADGDTVEDLLSDLNFLRADGFIDDAPSDAELGLDVPAYQVEIVAAAGEGDEAPARTRLAIGSASDGTHRAVRGSAENVLYQIGVERLEDFPRTVVAFRFKDLADFEASDAVRFELVFPAAGEEAPQLVSGQRIEGAWTTTPETMDSGKASRMIGELSKLTAVDIVADAMGDDELRALGLSPPAVTLRAFGEGEGEDAVLLAEIRLGDADPERGVAAQRSGDDVVYRLEYDTAELIPISREAFENRFRSSEEPPEEQSSGDASGDVVEN
jgi:hypothetical protein